MRKSISKRSTRKNGGGLFTRRSTKNAPKSNLENSNSKSRVRKNRQRSTAGDFPRGRRLIQQIEEQKRKDQTFLQSAANALIGLFSNAGDILLNPGAERTHGGRGKNKNKSKKVKKNKNKHK